MSKGIYTGVGGTARKTPKLYVGVNGIARKVKKGYVGVNGVARLFYSSKPPRLPSGYTELDYIYASSSYTYIATNIKPAANTTVIVDAQMLPNDSYDYSWVGNIVRSYYSAGSIQAYFLLRMSYSSKSIFFRDSYTTNSDYYPIKETQIASNLTSRFQISMNTNGTCTINGVEYSPTGSSLDNFPSISGMSAIELFRGCQLKLYSFQIYSGGALKMDLVPCKNSVGMVGMYDLVGDKLYQSATSSAPFLAGPTA